MSLFANLSGEGLEESQDRLGGFSPLDTAIYKAVIKAFYAGASDSGAMNITILADVGGKEYRETIYITNKEGKNYYFDKNDKDKTKKIPLPGFTIVDDICLIAAGAPLSEMETEEKIVKVYDSTAKAEVPKAVPMVTALLGQEVYLAIARNLENKTEKQGNEYVATAETRETNNIEKVFHPEQKITVVEARTGQTEPKFFEAWAERNNGVTRDRRSVKDGQGSTSGAPTKGGAAPAGQAPRKSLFNK